VEGAAVFRAIGEWHALQNRWPQATERFAQLLQVNQLDGLDVSTLDCLELGPALVEQGDGPGYERFRMEAIARFSGTAGLFADRIIKISLLRPADEKLLASLKPMAEETAKYFAEADQTGDAFTAAWRAVALALWEYRRGNFASAIDWCQRCLAYPESNAPRAATAQVILALSRQRQGRRDEARAALAVAREIIESKSKTRVGRGTPVQGFWFDWDFALILQREAAEVIEPPAGTP
jgi:hypothetical protein